MEGAQSLAKRQLRLSQMILGRHLFLALIGMKFCAGWGHDQLWQETCERNDFAQRKRPESVCLEES